MTAQKVRKRTYPWHTRIDGKPVTLRLMTAKDKESVLAFARSLSENDLLFLSFDITQEEFLNTWIKRIEAKRWHTILVEINDRLVGYGSLMRTDQIWSRHLGEITLLLTPEMRGKGLGSILAGEIFTKAKELNLQKVVARMAADQHGAIQVFERLGFTAEALLADYVIDRNDKTHDLLAMSYDVRGLTAE